MLEAVQACRYEVGCGADMGVSGNRQSSAVSPPAAGAIAIYLARDPIDFRLGINGLSVLVESSSIWRN